MSISYSGPSVSSVFAAGVINQAWEQVTLLEAESATATSKLNASKKQIYGAALPQSLLTKTTETDNILDAQAAVIDGDWLLRRDRLATERAAVVAGIAQDAKFFCKTYFSDGLDGTTVYDDAEAWINGLFLSGGSGVPYEVQLRAADAERIRKSAARATIDAYGGFAAFGSPLPQRVIDQQVRNVAIIAGDMQGFAERNARVKSWEVEVDNTKFATDRSVSLRYDSVDRCRKFMSEWVARRYDQATKRSTERLDLALEVQDAYYKFMSSELALRDNAIERYLTTFGIETLKWKTKEEFKDQVFKLRVKSLDDQLKTLSTRASAAINSIHVSAQATGSESL